MIRRRDVLALVPGLAAAAGAVRAQQVRRIGMLITGAPPNYFAQALPGALRPLGWAEDAVAFDVRYAEGRAERAAEHAAALVGRGVDLIVCQQTPAVRAAREATRTIPLVMAGVGGALHAGFVESLARPGGNLTGVADLAAELGPRRLQLLRDIIPGLACVGALASSHDVFTRPFLDFMESGGAGAGIRIAPVLVGGPDEFADAFAALVRQGAQAVVVQGIFNPNRDRTLALAGAHRLPLATWDRETTAAGGLLSLSTSRPEVLRRVASFVDRVLKGASPGELPVEQPTTFELEINLATARRLGFAVPQSVLIAADEIFE